MPDEKKAPNGQEGNIQIAVSAKRKETTATNEAHIEARINVISIGGNGQGFVAKADWASNVTRRKVEITCNGLTGICRVGEKAKGGKRLTVDVSVAVKLA